MRLEKLSLFMLCAGAANCAASASTEKAEAILRKTGVRGGLVVHLGCKDGTLTAQLCASPAFLVHGLDHDARNVEAARRRVQSQGLDGKVTVDTFAGDALPLIDNVVNLLIDDSAAGRVSRPELMRVLAPGGMALLKQRTTASTVKIAGETWAMLTKPVPAEVDEWTHYLHGPDNNAVSRDRVVSYPCRIQWVGNPVWTRNHNHLNGYSAVVSAGGRVFYILDDGPLQSINYTPRWQLVARDAHNGIVLWRRDIDRWEGHLRPFRSGPTELPRRLVASGSRVYVTLGYGGPLSILDAATGADVRVVAGTEGTHEIIHSDGVLYLVAGKMDRKAYRAALAVGKQSPPIRGKRIIAASEATGKLLWEKSNEDTRELLPTTLCADQTRLFFQSPNHLVCLEKKSGRVLWRTPRPIEFSRLGWSAPTVVVHGSVVLCAEGKFGARAKGKKARKGKRAAPAPASTTSGPWRINWTVTANPRSTDGGELIAFNAEDGSELWRCPAAFGYSSPPNVFVANGLVWVSQVPGINKTDMTEGRDLHTGDVKRKIDTSRAFEAAHHHRCYRDKATEQYLLFGRTGVEYVNLHTGEIQRHFWVRGTCQYGIMPANGLLYLPGHSCGCYIQSKLNGFWALSSTKVSGAAKVNAKDRLDRGPAYDSVGNRKSAIANPEDWPIHRHDNARTSCTSMEVSTKLSSVWSTSFGGEISAPVVAGGKAIVALKDKHIVAALEAAGGKHAWSFRAGGRIDSAPTVSRGLVAFGSHDGYVYCLRLSDGQMVWRFRAAPEDRRTVAFGQLESVWPVVGSVSVVGNTLYCVAGRSSYLDGGMVLCRLDLTTGREIGRTSLYSRDPETGEQPDSLLEDVELPGALPDILVVEGESLFLRDKQFDLQGREKVADYKPHLYSSGGLLNPEWWHRTIWIWGERAFGRASGWAIAGRFRPSGRLLTTDGPLVYGYKFIDRRPRGRRTTRTKHVLFCANKKVVKVDRRLKNNNAAVTKHMTPDKVVAHWSKGLDFAVRAMVKAGEFIVAAGPTDAKEIPFDDPEHPATLAVFSAKTGEILSTMSIPSQPVFDGMAAANGGIYLATKDGSLRCFR